jgi:hypothetical protein
VCEAVRKRQLLVSATEFSSQGCCLFHVALLWFPGFEHFAHSCLEHDFGRSFAGPVQPSFEIPNFYNVGNFGLPDLDGDSCRSLADFANPLMAAQRGEGLSDGFVKRFCGYVERMTDLVSWTVTVQDRRVTRAIYHIRHLFASRQSLI